MAALSDRPNASGGRAMSNRRPGAAAEAGPHSPIHRGGPAGGVSRTPGAARPRHDGGGDSPCQDPVAAPALDPYATQRFGPGAHAFTRDDSRRITGTGTRAS